VPPVGADPSSTANAASLFAAVVGGVPRVGAPPSAIGAEKVAEVRKVTERLSRGADPTPALAPNELREMRAVV
jgi:hypothetical protein